MADAAPYRARAATALLAVATVALVSLHVLASTRIELTRPVSAYALGQHAWIWQVATIAFGGSMLLRATLRGRALALESRLLIVTGLGLVTLALFPTDPWYPWEHMLTPTGWMHLIGTCAAFIGFGVASIRSQDRALRTLGYSYAGLLLVAVAGVGVAILLHLSTGFVGVIERVMLLVALAWLWLSGTPHRLHITGGQRTFNAPPTPGS